MYALLKKRKIIILLTFVVCITLGLIYFMGKDNQKPQLRIEIYSIDSCPLCEEIKSSLPKELKNKFGNNIEIDYLDVDKKETMKKYNNLIDSISNFKEEHKNRFPLINIDQYFAVVGYEYYYDSEIINDIIRMNNGEVLGKRLEKSRYVERD